MIHFFKNPKQNLYAVQTTENLSEQTISKLNWLFGGAKKIEQEVLKGFFVGPRAAMITPWSTNAVEITQNMDIQGIIRIEEFSEVSEDFTDFDPMLFQKYNGLYQDIFTINITPEPVLEIDNIEEYNQKEGLSLSAEEENISIIYQIN